MLLITSEPSFSSSFYNSQIGILFYLVQISSLFLINNLSVYIQFINTHTPEAIGEVRASLARLENCMFTVFTEMRDLNVLLSTILCDSSISRLTELYTDEKVQQCLEQLTLRILPLQITSILRCLMKYVAQVGLVLGSSPSS